MRSYPSRGRVATVIAGVALVAGCGGDDEGDAPASTQQQEAARVEQVDALKQRVATLERKVRRLEESQRRLRAELSVSGRSGTRDGRDSSGSAKSPPADEAPAEPEPDEPVQSDCEIAPDNPACN